MKYLITLIILTNICAAQLSDTKTDNTVKFNTFKFAAFNKKGLLKSELFFRDSGKTEAIKTVKKSKKSPGLALIYSLVVPGMGQLYTNRFDIGKYFLISEAALWLGYASFTIYGNWLKNDAYNYAIIHAGINKNGKDDDFFINIGNYDNVDQYNNERLLYGEYDKLYSAANGWGFWWDTPENRRRYREDRIAGERTLNDRIFITGAILLNHVISGISALILTNKYNDEIEKTSGGIRVNADIINFGSRVTGIKLNFVKNF
jgi:hypothetical protein